METDASEQTLDHVLKHPFFAKKSSLQEKISTPKESDGHDHSSETMNQYKGQHEKNGVDVTKAKPKKRASESGNVDQQKNAQSAHDIDELMTKDEVAEACGCGEVKDVTDVKKSYKSIRQQKEEKVDGRTKAYKETYSRIMGRLNAIKEKAKATQKETFQGK